MENNIQESSACDSDTELEQLAFKCADEYLKSIAKKKYGSSTEVNGYNKQNRIIAKKRSKSTMPDKIYLEKVNELPTCIDVSEIDLKGYINTDGNIFKGRKKVLSLYDVSSPGNKVLKKSVITPDFEAKHAAPVPLGKRAVQRARRKERLSTAGEKWFNLKPPEIDDEIKRDVEILQMRSVLDPKRFYKNNDCDKTPQYFQIGKVMDSAADFYSSRLPKKQRKQTLADELLADAKFQQYRKKKMSELASKRENFRKKTYKKKKV